MLIIEDNYDNREILKKQLGHLGYEVAAAANGLEGLKLAQQEKPDMVVIDIMMPGVDGREVAHRMRTELKMKDTPILAATVLFQKDDIQSCLDAGCNEVLSKPFTMQELKEKLAKLARLLSSRGQDS